MIKYGNSGNRFIITKTELEEVITKCHNTAIEAAAMCQGIDIFACQEIRKLKK
jgi:hypothetical protein